MATLVIDLFYKGQEPTNDSIKEVIFCLKNGGKKNLFWKQVIEQPDLFSSDVSPYTFILKGIYETEPFGLEDEELKDLLKDTKKITIVFQKGLEIVKNITITNYSDVVFSGKVEIKYEK